MKDKGTLTNWNASRGFGFIKCESYDSDVFIHISVLKDAARPPRVGDTIYFDRLRDDSGKYRAQYASIKGVDNKPVTENVGYNDLSADVVNVARNSSKPSVFLVLLGLLAMLYLYQTFSPDPLPIPIPEAVKNLLNKNEATNVYELPQFSCQGKQYCSQMVSCAEAKFYLKNCPNVKIDGNGDGVPCEKQWCG